MSGLSYKMTKISGQFLISGQFQDYVKISGISGISGQLGALITASLTVSWYFYAFNNLSYM